LPAAMVLPTRATASKYRKSFQSNMARLSIFAPPQRNFAAPQP
jgi:hypothetical protein